MKALRSLQSDWQHQVATFDHDHAAPIRFDVRLDDSSHDATTLEAVDRAVSIALANVSRYAIEDPAAREALGKEPSARISLCGRDSGPSIEVLLEHDGRDWRAALDEAQLQHGLEAAADAPLEQCIRAPHMGVRAAAELPTEASLLRVCLFERTPNTEPGLRFVFGSGSDGSTSAPCILLVEDEPNLSILLENILRDQGYRVQTARDGIEAIELLPNLDADALVTDVVMPGMNGLELLRRVRADDRWRELPLFAMTSGPGRSAAALSAGARSVFVKIDPDWLDELQLALANALARDRSSSADPVRPSRSPARRSSRTSA